MKSVLIFIGFFIFSLSVQGQQISTKVNTVRLGVSEAFYGHGDIFGTVLYGEYIRELNSYISFSPRAFVGYAHHEELYSLEQTSKSFGLVLSLKTTPFPRSFHRLKFDLGGFYHRFDSKIIDSISENNEIDNSYGIVGSISYNIIETYKTELGIRTEMFVDYSGNCLTCQLGIFGGWKF